MCTSQYGNKRCVCDLGFSGTFCQFQESQYFDLQNVANAIVRNLYAAMQAKTKFTPTDIEVVGTVLRGVLTDPDLVSESLFDEIIATVELIGSLEIFAFQPLTQNVKQIYFDALDTVF